MTIHLVKKNKQTYPYHLLKTMLPIWKPLRETKGFPCSSVGKESACSAEDLGLIPGLGRSPGEANGNPLQYPCLVNLMDRGTRWAAVLHKELGTTERLTLTYFLTYYLRQRF